MNGLLAGQGFEDMLGNKRHQRRHDLAQVYQNGIQGVKRLRIAFPETVARTADVPVVENFHKRSDFAAGQSDVIRFQPLLDDVAQVFELGKNIVVDRLAGRADFFGFVTFGIGIERKEVKSVPQRDLRDASRFGNLFALFVDGQVAAFQHRRRNQEPAQRVRAHNPQNIVGIRIVFQTL